MQKRADVLHIQQSYCEHLHAHITSMLAILISQMVCVMAQEPTKQAGYMCIRSADSEERKGPDLVCPAHSGHPRS